MVSKVSYNSLLSQNSLSCFFFGGSRYGLVFFSWHCTICTEIVSLGIAFAPPNFLYFQFFTQNNLGTFSFSTEKLWALSIFHPKNFEYFQCFNRKTLGTFNVSLENFWALSIFHPKNFEYFQCFARKRLGTFNFPPQTNLGTFSLTPQKNEAKG